MRVSVNITNYSWPGKPSELGHHLGRVVRAADEAGVDTVWVADHLIQADPNSTPDAEMIEGYTTLGFLAGQTRQIRLGTMVTCATYRAPAMLVKIVTTLDLLSGGRAWLGIGAGYHEAEARAMGLLLPPVGERFQRLDETLRIALHMWSPDNAAPFAGEHYQLTGPVTNPQPLRQPHPPILVGGMGEKKTLRLVAQYADACNMFDIPDGGRILKHKLSVLAAHCEDVGRPYDEIEKTLSTRLDPGESADSFVQRCGALAALGIEHVVVITNGPWTDDGIATLAAAIPSVAQLTP
jgi:F420-dependent oxidoreductase-like protein